MYLCVCLHEFICALWMKYPLRPEEGTKYPGTGIYRCLWAVMCGMGIETRSSASVASTPNHWSISSVQDHMFFKENLRWYFVYWSLDFSRNNPGFRRIKGILTKLFVISLPAKCLVQFWYHTFMYLWVSPWTSVCAPVLVPENLLC